jgi:hypothetical protein
MTANASLKKEVAKRVYSFSPFKVWLLYINVFDECLGQFSAEFCLSVSHLKSQILKYIKLQFYLPSL